MRNFLEAWRFLNVVSIDIAAGAVISALFFARIFDVNMLPYGLIALFLTVWIVYTADHLRDAKSIAKRASTTRHFFHQRHFKVMFCILVAAILIDFAMLFFLRKQVLLWGVVLSALVFVYLLIQRYLSYLKELFVALLYTWGVVLPSLSVTSMVLSYFQISLIIQFALIAFLNLLIFSWFDRSKDMRDRQSSFVTTLGREFSYRIMIVISCVSLAMSVLQIIWFGFDLVVAVPLLMNCLLLMTIIGWRFFIVNDNFRLVGDGVFFIPIISLIV